MIKYLVSLLAMFLVSGVVSAAPDTYWNAVLNGFNANGSTAQKTCERVIVRAGRIYGTTTMQSTTVAACNGYTGPTDTTLGQMTSALLKTCATNTPYFNDSLERCVADTPPPSCPSGQKGTGTWWTGSTPTDDARNYWVTGGCVNSCTVKMTDVRQCYSSPAGGATYCVYDYTSSGTTCGAGPDSPAPETSPPPPVKREDVPPEEAPDGKCPGGTVQGGVSADGVPICIGTGTDPKNAPPPPPKVESEKSEPTPDGGTKNTHTSTTTNSDGSTTTTTTTTTTAPDGTKTVTVDKNTTPNSAGGAGKDESKKDDEKYDLCKQNPQLTICRNSSVAGTCGQISCQGDAIQCATLRAAAAMQCQQQSDLDTLKTMPSKALGDAILGGTDPQKTAIEDLVKGTQVDMSKPVLDQSGFIGGGACLANRTVTVLGQSVEVNFTRVCQDIQPIRAAVMALAFFAAYLIVSRSVLGS